MKQNQIKTRGGGGGNVPKLRRPVLAKTLSVRRDFLPEEELAAEGTKHAFFLPPEDA